MDTTYITFLVVIPIVLFLTAAFMARQFRALENVPIISAWFVHRRLIISVVWGLLMSGIASFVIFFRETFSAWAILGFAVLFLVSTGSFYFGIILGWGKPATVGERPAPIIPNSTTALPNNIAVDDSFNSIKISICAQKRWALFMMSVFQWVIFGLCALPIFGLVLFSAAQNYLPKGLNILVGIIIGGLVIYLIYTKFREVMEYIDDKEIIEIDSLSVKIETSGSGITSKKEYPAENIKMITGLFSFGEKVEIKRSRFLNSNFHALMLWHNRGLKRYHSFGRAIDAADAQTILENIYSKFPQYKG